jgi:hypothetical protein
MKASTLRFSLTPLAILFMSAQLTGCFVAVEGGGYDDDYEYSHSDGVDYSSDRSVEVSEESYEETFEESYEETFEETIEETVVETTTTTSSPDLPVESTPVSPAIVHLEERFESPRLGGVDQVSVSRLGQWAIEWTEGSACERLRDTASILIQSEVDLGRQYEVEGDQHARLDGVCGQDLNPVRLVTSLSEVRDAERITFFARSASTAPGAWLMIEWGDQIMMDEELLDVWAEYTIDLTQVDRPDDVLFTLTALTPGVLIDHIIVD